MGNIMSEEEEAGDSASPFFEEGTNLEDPDADRKMNVGTAAPTWHSPGAADDEQRADPNNPMSPKHPRDPEGDNHRSKRPHRSDSQLQQQQQQPEDPKKMSYVQMARLGYQELVNAIIRPPRADYKMEALGPPAFTFCGKRFTVRHCSCVLWEYDTHSLTD